MLEIIVQLDKYIKSIKRQKGIKEDRYVYKVKVKIFRFFGVECCDFMLELDNGFQIEY